MIVSVPSSNKIKHVLACHLKKVFIAWTGILFCLILTGLYILLNEEVIQKYKHNKVPLISEAIYETGILLPVRVLIVLGFIFVYYYNSPFFLLAYVFFFLSFSYEVPLKKAQHTTFIVAGLCCLYIEIFTQRKLGTFLQFMLLVLPPLLIASVFYAHASHSREDEEYVEELEWSRSNFYILEYILITVVVFVVYLHMPEKITQNVSFQSSS